MKTVKELQRELTSNTCAGESPFAKKQREALREKIAILEFLKTEDALKKEVDKLGNTLRLIAKKEKEIPYDHEKQYRADKPFVRSFYDYKRINRQYKVLTDLLYGTTK